MTNRADESLINQVHRLADEPRKPKSNSPLRSNLSPMHLVIMKRPNGTRGENPVTVRL